MKYFGWVLPCPLHLVYDLKSLQICKRLSVTTIQHNKIPQTLIICLIKYTILLFASAIFISQWSINILISPNSKKLLIFLLFKHIIGVCICYTYLRINYKSAVPLGEHLEQMLGCLGSLIGLISVWVLGVDNLMDYLGNWIIIIMSRQDWWKWIWD